MGTTCSSYFPYCCFRRTSERRPSVYYTSAIKSPHGLTYKYYERSKGEFQEGQDINTWIQGLYKTEHVWTDFMVYNDQTDVHGTTHGHCKGIITWNTVTKRLSWLVHSVPHFPQTFKLNEKGQAELSNIEHAEELFAQSFIYIEIDYENGKLHDILEQVYHMQPHIYLSNTVDKVINKKHKTADCKKLWLGENLFHVAKSPKDHIDIYEDFIVDEFGGPCLVETWLRGQVIKETDAVTHIKEMMGTDNKSYTESHDHSKIALSAEKRVPWVCIGDLNRMESQKSRGGGGIIVLDEKLWLAYRSLIIQ
jgi:deoxyribonuclease-2